MSRYIFGWIVAAALAAPLAAQSTRDVTDLDGRATAPLAPAAGQVNLLLFLNAECPISSRYAPEMDRISAEYAKRGVRTWLIYADPALTPAAARENLQKFHPHTNATVVIDKGLTLTVSTGVTVTPEAVVFGPAGRAYRGRIDDLYLNIGQARRAPTVRDLRLALDAVLAGRPVSTPETQAVGCFIERKRP